MNTKIQICSVPGTPPEFEGNPTGNAVYFVEMNPLGAPVIVGCEDDVEDYIAGLLIQARCNEEVVPIEDVALRLGL